MQLLNDELSERLAGLRHQGLLRELRSVDSSQGTRINVGGKRLLNFSSNDYLGLANHPVLKSAAIKAIEKYGVGCGASRLICGSLKPHGDLEEALSDFKDTQAALSFSSGYTAVVGTICALMGKEDLLIVDRLVHASVIDAARLCGAKLRIFHHNDLNDLDAILQSVTRRSGLRQGHFALPPNGAARTRRAVTVIGTKSRLEGAFSARVAFKSPRVLIVTESVFSMDGDRAPLREIVELKEKYGAWLMVDEAHATGLYGSAHRGIADELRVNNRIEIQMGTLGKALGSVGGYVAGSRALIDFLINRARPFVFSTAPLPAASAAAQAGIGVVQSKEGDLLRKSLWKRVSQLSSKFEARPSSEKSCIIPIIFGAEENAVRAAAILRQQGIYSPAIRYPTVARNKARLRVTLSAGHTSVDVRKLLAALGKLKRGNLSKYDQVES